MYTSVRVEGLGTMVRQLEQLGLEVEDLKDAFGEIAAEGADVAAGFVESESGDLAATLRGNRAKSKAVVTAGRASVRYAGVQNYGWPKRNIRAQLFMKRTDEVMEPRAVHLLEQNINRQIRKKGLT